MNREERIELYKAVIAEKGEKHQKNKAIEEFAELIVELAKDRNGQGNKLRIVDELADAYIMCEQLFVMEGRSDIYPYYTGSGLISALTDVISILSDGGGLKHEDCLNFLFSLVVYHPLYSVKRVDFKLQRLERRLRNKEL